MPTQILRNIMGRLLGLGPNHELIMAGSKILYGHGSNLDAQVDLVSAVQCLLQCAIPFISPSSGTMGNNGALSGITALRQTYPAAWFVVPANYIFAVFFFSSRRRHTRSLCDWSSDVCSSDLWPRPS